jgi:hypothetical protein
MQKLLAAVLLIGILASGVCASAPVHIALKANAVVTPDSGGFFTLGSVADMTGGEVAERDRLSKVIVGRAPLPNDVRQLGRGDIDLKLRQAGIDPDTRAVVEGAEESAITVASSSSAASSPVQTSPAVSGTDEHNSTTAPAAPLIHRGDEVTILIQNGDLTVTAKGTARDPGAAGDTIHVHRDGVNSDLVVTVLDAQTVQLSL